MACEIPSIFYLTLYKFCFLYHLFIQLPKGSYFPYVNDDNLCKYLLIVIQRGIGIALLSSPHISTLFSLSNMSLLSNLGRKWYIHWQIKPIFCVSYK